MKSKFPDYYRPSDDEYRQLWQNADIVLDTNVLLDFYRVSDTTYQDMFKVFGVVKERLWIPYQTAKEYHNRIQEVIVEQEGKYCGTLDFMNSFEEQLAQKRNHPFLSNELYNKTKGLFEELQDFIKKQQEKLLDNLKGNNSSKDKIGELFNSRVWDKLSEETIEEIRKEGEERYKNKIPPGYKDKGKGDNKFGDLIIWKEILKWSKENSHPIIFVTNDEKQDWFFQCEGKTIGPNQTLINEFGEQTGGQRILIYQLHQFLKFSKDYLKVDVDTNSVEELRETQRNISTNIAEEIGDKISDECAEKQSILLEKNVEYDEEEIKSDVEDIPAPIKNNQQENLQEKGEDNGCAD